MVALDKNDGTPTTDLQQSDLRLQMDRLKLPIFYFDHGVDAPLRPLTI